MGNLERLLDKIESPRLRNMLLVLFNVLLFMTVYFLGMDAAYWSNQQIKQYCENYNMLPKCQINYNITVPNISTTGTTVLNISR